MIFGRKVSEIVFNNLDNCKIILVNEELSSAKIKLLNNDFNYSKSGKILSVNSIRHRDIDPFRDCQNLFIPIKDIKKIEFNNCNINLIFGMLFETPSLTERFVLNTDLFFKNSKVNFGKVFQESMTAEFVCSDITITEGASFKNANLKVLKDSSVHIDNSFIENLNLSLGDRDTLSDNSMFEMHKGAFSKILDLEMKAETVAYLNVLEEPRISKSEFNFNHLKINGNSDIKVYEKNQENSLTYLEGDDYKNLIKNITLGKMELLKIYRSYHSDWLYAVEESYEKNKLVYPNLLQLSLDENKRNKEYEEELKRLEIRLKEEELNISPIDFMRRLSNYYMKSSDLVTMNSSFTLKERSENEISIMKGEREVRECKLLEKKAIEDLRRSEIEAIEAANKIKEREYQAVMEMKKAEAEIINSENSGRLDRTLYYKKLFNILNTSCPTDNINIENKGYVISSLKKTFSDNILLTKKQKINRNKLCILYDIKQTKAEVIF